MKTLKFCTSLAALVTGFGFLIAAPCSRAQLPAANISESYIVGIGIGGGVIIHNTTTAGPLSYSGSGAYGSTSLSLSGSNNPSPNFSATGTLSIFPIPDEDPNESGIDIDETYDMEINGPQPTVSVLVDAQGHVSLDKTIPFNDGNSSVMFTVRTGFGAFTVDDSIQAGPDPSVQPTSASFDDDNVYTFETGKVYAIGVSVDVGLAVPFGISDTVTGSASIDPTFNIASSVSDPGDYTFEFSSGIGNTALGGGGTSSVPDEASTLGLLACLAIGMITLSRCNHRHLADEIG
jgi:hypothetical protein